MKPTVPVILLFLVCVVLIFAVAGGARAAELDSVSSPSDSSPHISKGSTLTVTKTADTNDGVCDGDCSLREAVGVAVSGDTVVFSALFNTPQTITLTLGRININRNLTINGTGQDLVTVSGNNASMIFLIFVDGVTVNISGMTFREGNGESPTFGIGGAIRIIGSSTLNVSNATFTNNRTGSISGEGSALKGSENSTITLSNLVVVGNVSVVSTISSSGSLDIRDSIVKQNTGSGIGAHTLNVERCDISDNTKSGVAGQHLTITDSIVTNNADGGVDDGDAASTMTIERCRISGNRRSPGGGGINSSGTTTIKDTQIRNNIALADFGGGIAAGITLYLVNSVVSGNRNSDSSFGEDGGGGILNSSGRLFAVNSTISGNTALGNPGVGGGIYNLSSTSIRYPVYLVNSTLANNTSGGAGGGVFINPNGDGTFSNTVVAGNNSTGTKQEDVSGIIISNGINLIGNTFGSSGWIAGDLLNVNPMLGSLADNGGLTMTHALLPGSPAIDAGNNALAVDPQTQMFLIDDQRGFPRRVGELVDIGAYESTQTASPVIAGSVTYGLASPRFVPNVLISGVGSPNVSATTLGAGPGQGTYLLSGFGSSSYTVTPTKTGDANGLSSFDSGRIAQHITSINLLTGNQLIVADVSGNGTLSSFDAGQIARYITGLNGSGSTGNWVFIPVNRTYPSVTSNMTGEDFIALLMGDVSGNWMPGGSGPLAVGSKQSAVRGQNHPAVAGGLTSTNRAPIMVKNAGLQPPATAGGSDKAAGDSLMGVDRLIGESVGDYQYRRATADIQRLRSKARVENELRQRMIKSEVEYPKWAENWVKNVWQGGNSGITAKQSRLPMLTDPGDPNVMWKWDKRGWLSKSLDGGANWERLPYTYDNQWRYVSSLATARENGKTILLAGVMGESFSFDSGIMRSDDGGLRWYRVCDGFAALSVAFDPDDPQNAIAEIIAPPDAFFGHFATSRVVFSTDAGKHWQTATQNGVKLETDAEKLMKALARRKTTTAWNLKPPLLKLEKGRRSRRS